jgi:glycosyltransferase involved in cell wall biosynthesis
MKLCLVWQRFGPYHNARLRACVRLLANKNVEVIGVQVADRGGPHPYDSSASDIKLTTLFPNATVETLPRRRVFKAVLSLLDRVEPDAIALPAYSRPESQAGLWWARAFRRTAIVMTESRHEDAARSAIREHIKREIVSQFDAALAGGTPQARYTRALGIPSDCIFTPYDVVDNAYFAAGAAAARSNRGAFEHLPGLERESSFFLACGRFIKRKNFDTLIESYERYVAAKGDGETWGLVLLGDGPERSRLAERANALKPPARVTFAGYRKGAELCAYYGLAGAFIHPARMDQWGLVVNEAMAAGLPILASTGVGAAEDLVVEGVNGYVFDPDDHVIIADAMLKIASLGAERAWMGHHSRVRIAAWSPAEFAEGMFRAVTAGENHSDRPLPTHVKLLLQALNRLPERAHRWASIEQ